jgi:hypothetical protein
MIVENCREVGVRDRKTDNPEIIQINVYITMSLMSK